MVWVILFPFVILPAHDWTVQHVRAIGDAVFVVSLRAGSERCFFGREGYLSIDNGNWEAGAAIFILILKIRDI